MLDPLRHQVLIVEDDAPVRTSLTMLLQASGYEVRTAANGLEALELLKAGNPAILLSDLNMLEMPGLELLTLVRQQFPRLPVVAMSGDYESRDDVPGGMIVDAFYAKGYCSPGILLRILAEVISVRDAKHGQAKPLIN